MVTTPLGADGLYPGNQPEPGKQRNPPEVLVNFFFFFRQVFSLTNSELPTIMIVMDYGWIISTGVKG